MEYLRQNQEPQSIQVVKLFKLPNHFHHLSPNTLNTFDHFNFSQPAYQKVADNRFRGFSVFLMPDLSPENGAVFHSATFLIRIRTNAVSELFDDLEYFNRVLYGVISFCFCEFTFYFV